LRLAALPARTATDAPAVAPGAGARASLVARPAEAPATGTGPVVLAQAPALPPMPAAARSGFAHTPTPGRPGPFGAADGQGRPGLTTQAQAPGLPQLVQPPGGAPGTARPPAQPVPIMLDAGAGRLLQLPAPAFTIMAADPRVLRVQPASPTSIFVMGVAGGRSNIIATAEDGSLVVEYDVTVAPGRTAAALPTTNAATPQAAALNAANIESMIRRLVRGGEGVRVANLGNNGLVLSGLVPSAAEAQRAEAIAKAYAGEGRPVVNNISLLSAIQVNLRVRVAEVSRTVTRELGFNWAVLANDGANFLIGMRTGAAASIVDAITGRSLSTDTSPGRYAARFSSSRFDINAVVDALAGDQLISILAEPNLTAQSGEVASFLAGGEFPVPVTASPLTGAVGIEFKQFGVSLGFVPTVLSPERLNLRVRPEVSELTENGAISLPLAGGVVRIPALAVRRAETTIELGSGQSFAIAGLLQRSTVMAGSGLIGLGDIPVIGALFRSDRFRRAETELVIIITPYLVRPVSEGQALATPNEGFRPATDLDRIVYRRQIARGAPPTQPRMPADAGFIVE
jgi:pilus assembly protein CpaC